VAIALDGGVPEYGADRPAGQPRLGIFKRQPDGEPRGPFAPAPAGRPAGAGGLDRADVLSSLACRQAAQTESIAAAQEQARQPDAPAAGTGFDVRLVKESFGAVTDNAALAMEYFYSHLFAVRPETRGMFPMGMSQMRERLFASLARLVEILDNPRESAAYLAQLGRDHRKYGVKDKHYHAFFAALLETVAHFSGPGWTRETDGAWQAVLAYAARTMRSAAEEDGRDHPAWWVGEIVRHDRRGDTVAVLTIRPDRPLPYRPGQYLTVQVTRWPRVWRAYSIANAPRASGLIDLHVRAVSGGLVSTALVRHVAAGDTLVLGPACGAMSVPDNDRDLLCVAGGTGLAPVKAIIEGAIHRDARPRRITLFAGARRQQDLYDLPDLQRLQAACPSMRVIPVLSDETVLPGVTWISGLLPDVVRGHGLFENSEAFISGPAAMVRQTALLLAAHVAPEQIHHDPVPDDYLPPGQPAPAEPAPATLTELSVKFARPGARR
jgi:NAD(P)H-flavin reductase/hemoglobin-like flavoprotein